MRQKKKISKYTEKSNMTCENKGYNNTKPYIRPHNYI